MGRVKVNNIFQTNSIKVISILLFALFFSGKTFSQQQEIDSIEVWKNQYQTSKDERRQLDLLNRISTALCNEKPKDCLPWCNKQIDLAIKLKDSEKLIDAYLNASVSSRELAQFKEALEFNLKAVKESERAKDTLNMGHAYNYLAIFYHVTLDYTSAEKNYLKSLEFFKRVNDVKSQYVILANLSDVYVNTNRKKEAEVSLKKSIIGRKEIGNTRSIGIGYYSLGCFLLNEKKYDDGLLVLDTSLIYFLKSAETFFYWQALVQKGTGLYLASRYKESNELLTGAIKGDFVKNNPDMLYAAYGALSRNYEELNNVKEALKYARLEKSLSDTIFKKENLNALNDAQAKFDTEKQEKEIELLNKEKKISETELSRQKTIRNTFIFGSIIVVVFSFFILRSLRINRRAKKLISEQKETLELKNKEVMDSIHYAKRIQSALLPSHKYVEKVMNRLKDSPGKDKF